MRGVLHNSAWIALSQLADRLLRFFTLPLLLGLYGRENYGLIGLVYGIHGFLQMLALGTPMGFVKYVSEWLHHGDRPKINRCANTSLSFYTGVGILCFLVFLATAFAGGRFFSVTERQQEVFRNLLLIFAVYSLVFWPNQVLQQLLMAAEEIHFVQKVEVACSILQFACVLAVVHWHVRLDVFFALRLLIGTTNIPVLLFRWRRYCALRETFRLGWQWQEFSPVMKYGLSLLALGVLHGAFLELRPVALGVQGNSTGCVADFTILTSIVGILLIIERWVRTPLFPSVTKALAAGDHAYLEFVTVRVTKYCWSAITFGAVLMAICGREILVLYLGPDYARLAPWLGLFTASALSAYLGPVTPVIFAQANLKPYILSNAIFALLCMAVLWFTAPLLGVGSAVISTTVYFVLQVLYHHLYYFPRIMRIDSWRMFKSAFLKPTIAAVLGAGVLLFIRKLSGLDNDFFLLAILTTAASLPLFLLVFYYGVLETDERHWLNQFVVRSRFSCADKIKGIFAR